MCGIAGFWLLPPRPQSEAEDLLRAMTDALSARGPDDSGTWLDLPAGVGLGHRRLSIIDLSPAGRQPMVSSCGRWVISTNGEIYNFTELRDDLRHAGRPLRGRSDTEALLESISLWGFEPTLSRLIGMFAIALWDRRERRLILARDRLGKKPMYFHLRDRALLFGSELKALCRAPFFRREVDPQARALFLRWLYIPAPTAIYRDTRKLEPGQYATFEEADGRIRASFTTYWDAAPTSNGEPADVVASFERLLKDAVARRLVADVPVGVLLSGGLDSSTVAAIVQELHPRPARTFTIGFTEARYDEAPAARAIARHLGTEHTELTVTSREALDVIPSLPHVFDEPFADPSQIPTLVVARLARRQVTVAISGDGGDELLGGYDRYAWTSRLWKAMRRWPRPLRRGLGTALTMIPPDTWNRVLGPLRAAEVSGHRLHRVADILGSEDIDALYLRLMSHWTEPTEGDPVVETQRRLTVAEPLSRMMLLDLKTYLPEDVLVKVDRASMSVGLEVRSPLLDHRLVEFVGGLPEAYKVRDGVTKWILRQVLHRRVPSELVDRPKAGFGAPIERWLRGPLRDWAEGLLSERALIDGGFRAPGVIRRHWREHLERRRNWEYRLWAVLMLQAWHQSEASAVGPKIG